MKQLWRLWRYVVGLMFVLWPSVVFAVPLQTYQTSFEFVGDFSGFYISPQDHMNSTSHDQSTQRVRSGQFSHMGWVTAPNPASSRGVNNNHRGYPTVQMYKRDGGAFKTPALVELWVWLDMDLKPGEWFSFATLDHTTSNRWDSVLVNLSDEGFVHLMHVPTNGQGVHTFQTSSIKFPFRQWVKLSMEIHFDRENGYAKVWQDGQLVSAANVRKGNGYFTQAHFGLYAPPSVSAGIIYNDDLKITELRSP